MLESPLGCEIILFGLCWCTQQFCACRTKHGSRNGGCKGMAINVGACITGGHVWLCCSYPSVNCAWPVCPAINGCLGTCHTGLLAMPWRLYPTTKLQLQL